MIGKTISHYRILEKLGEGAMGMVYQAQDLKLDRLVALKFLPAYLEVDESYKKRFALEAKAASRLDHPNICTIYEIGEMDDGQMFIAMAHYDGESLRDKLKHGPLPVAEAVDIATQIAEGLAKAHSRDIIHRDIKPANIMVTSEGVVKIVDFGLAKISGIKITKTDSTLGTLAYMSPEQMRGEVVDQRADIWSWGVLVYEMLAVQLPFPGNYEQEIMFQIMHEEIQPIQEHCPELSPDMTRVIERALEKEPDQRYHQMADVLTDLDGVSDVPADLKGQRKSRSLMTVRKWKIKSSQSRKISFFVIITMLVVAGIYLLKIEPAKQIPVTHTKVTFTGDASWPALSPDGQFMAYTSGIEGVEQKLLVQDLSGGPPLEIFREQRVLQLRWSPDGTELLFFAANDSARATYILPRLGGRPQSMEAMFFLSWSPDGSQVAGGASDLDFFTIISKVTGEKSTIKLDTTFTWLWGLDWSSTGNWFLFFTHHEQKYTIWTITKDAKPIHKIVEDDAQLFYPLWSPNGDAIYYFRFQDQTKDLMKIAVDPETGQRKGDASIVQSGLQSGDYFMVSKDSKLLLYTRRQESSNLWLVTVEESSKVKTKQLTRGTSVIKHPNVSPDGKQIVFSVGTRPGTANIFTMPVEGGDMQQLTFLESLNYEPAWSPDGTQVAFGSSQGEGFKVWQVDATGGTPRQFSGTNLGEEFQLTWAPGTDILYRRPGAGNFHFLNSKTEEERPLLQNVRQRDLPVGYVSALHAPRFSPDAEKLAVWWMRWPSGDDARTSADSTGLWVISRRDNSRRFLYKRILPGVIAPIGWSPDGQWIYAVEHKASEDKANVVMINEVTAQAKKLVTLPFAVHALNLFNNNWFSMTPDGKQFIFPVVDTRSDVWLIENFDPEVK